MGDESASTASTASSASSVSSASSASSVAPGEAVKDTAKTKLMIAAAIALIVIIIILLLLLGGSSSSESKGSGGGDDDNTKYAQGGGGGGGKSSNSKPGSNGTNNGNHGHNQSTPAHHHGDGSDGTPGPHHDGSDGTLGPHHDGSDGTPGPHHGGGDDQPTPPTVTTQRPIPPESLLCTYGKNSTESSAFPDDGVCDFTALEATPFSEASDFGGPYPAAVEHFIDTAAKSQKTEFALCLDYAVWNKTEVASKDPAVKAHLDALLDKRIFHYCYFNMDVYVLQKEQMAGMLGILKRLTGYLEDKKTQDRPIYTFMTAAYIHYHTFIKVEEFAKAFKTILMPDLLIARAHITYDDSAVYGCRILPSNLVKPPQDVLDAFTYFTYLYSAVSLLEQLRSLGIQTPALSVTVGVYGRWYSVNTTGVAEKDAYSPGNLCGQKENPSQMESIAHVCKETKYGSILTNAEVNCNYVMDKQQKMTFAFDSPTTLRYKLCTSKKNATGLHYGITVALLEYSDATGHCGWGNFPILTQAKKTLTFFNEKYKSPDAYQDCMSDKRSAEEDEDSDVL